jgi:ABC-type branched-subunit amino acid transport system substrate-binding protein
MPTRARACKPQRFLPVLAAVAVLTGCPSRFDPRAETVKASPNADADHAYRQARARLDIGDFRDAVEKFADFLKKYPDDPLAPSAKIGQARAEIGLGAPDKARALVEPLAGHPSKDDPVPTDPTQAKARYLYGLALHRQGEHARAREVLRPFVDAIRPGDDAYELRAVLAEDAAAVGDVEDALRQWDLFWPGARPAEKEYVKARISELVGKLSALETMKLWSALDKNSIGAAFVGRRLAAERRAAGDLAGEKAFLDDSQSARERAGLESAKGKAAIPVARRGAMGRATIGIAVPLSGKSRALGERAMRGALLAAELLGGTGATGDGAAIELRVRDTGSDPARAASAIAELAEEGVLAVIGSPAKNEAQLQVSKAAELGVPFFQLARDDAKRGETTFKMVRPRSAVAVALVERAKRGGAKSVAVLAPDSAYGREMAQSLVEAARAAGLRVAADLRYPESATTFVEPARRVRDAGVDALLIPAPASHLALIAPQLGAMGLVRMVNVKPTGKQLTVYATGDGVNASVLLSTGKYLQGAVLAPTFFADAGDPAMASFLDRYRRSYGEEPSGLDALSFDAVRAARLGAMMIGDDAAKARANLALQLGRASEERGVSGALGFSGGERVGAPHVYVVDGNELKLAK